MNRPYHRAGLVSLDLDGWQSQLVKEQGEGASSILQAAIPWLQGSLSIEGIWGKLLNAGYSPEHIAPVLEFLDQHNLLQEYDPEARLLSDGEVRRHAIQMQLLASPFQYNRHDVSSWERAGGSQQVALKKASLLVVNLGVVGRYLAHTLALAGVGRLTGIQAEPDQAAPGLAGPQETNPFVEYAEAPKGRDLASVIDETRPNLVVYSPDAFDPTYAESLNSLCLQHSVPLLVYCRKGFVAELGPLVIPRQTACYVCYDRRRKAAVRPWETYPADVETDLPRFDFPLGVDWIAVEVIKFLTGITEPITQGRVLALNFLSGMPQLHSVLKLPRCPACGAHNKTPMRKLWEE